MSDVVGHARIDVTADTSGVTGELRRVASAIERMSATNASGFAKSADAMTKSVRGFGDESAKQADNHSRVWKIAFGNIVAYATQSLVFGTAALVKFGLETQGTIEQARRTFQALSGSAEEAGSIIARLRKVAIATPFEFAGLAETTSRVYAVKDAIGLTGKTMQETQDNIFGFVNAMGDLVTTFGGTQQQFDNAVLAVSQMGSQGHIAAQEMRQLNDALPGFNAWKQLAQGMGISEEQLRKLVKQGKIASTDALPILLKQIKEFPGAAGAMTRAAGTITGVLSNIKDAMGLALSDGLQPLTDALITAFAPGTPGLEQLQGAFTQFGLIVSDVFKAIAPLIPDFLRALGSLFTLVGGVVAVLAPVIAVIGRLVLRVNKAVFDRLIAFGRAIGGWWKEIEPTRVALRNFVTDTLQPITDWARANPEVMKTIADAIQIFALSLVALYEAATLLSTLTTALKAVSSLAGVVGLLGVSGPVLIVLAIVAAVVALAAAAYLAYKRFKGFRDIVDSVGRFFRDLWDGIFKWFEENWDNISDVVQGVWSAITTGVGAVAGAVRTAVGAILTAWNSTWGAVEAAVQPVIDFIVGLWTQYGDEVTGIVVGVKDIIVSIFNIMKALIVPILNDLGTAWSNVFDTMRTVVETVWPLISAIIEGTVGFIIGIIQTFVAIIAPLWESFWIIFSAVVNGAYTIIRGIIEGLLQFIEGIINVIAGILSGDWGRIWDGVVGIVNSSWTVLRGILEAVVNFFQTVWSNLSTIISAPFKAAWESIKGVWNTALGYFTTIIDGIKGVVNSFIRGWNSVEFPSFTVGGWDIPGPGPDIPSVTIGGFGLPHIPQLALGAILDTPTLALLAERGREVVIPLSNPARARQLANESGLTQQLMGTTSVVTIGTANFVQPTDIDLLFQKAEAAMVLTGSL